MQKNEVMTESRESVERERRDRSRYEMDSSEAARVLYKRILELEPESLAKKIMGYILVHEDELEFGSLSHAPDYLIHNLIRKYKIYIAFLSNPSVSPPISPSINPSAISDHPLHLNPFSRSSSRHFSPPASFHLPNLYWENQQSPHSRDFLPLGYSDSVPEDYVLQNHTQFVGLEDHLESVSSEISGFSSDNYIPESAFANLCLKRGQRSSSLPEFPVKTCHYFNKGFCKHGSNCRYFHGQPFPEIFGTNLNEFVNEDHFFVPGSLEKLELEITELLKSRRGHPVSIASLPMIYYEKYGRTLQAEGYLTESQRHGKAGYSLTKLLARLKNSIRLIDRPHGQHSVILAEDAPKYMDNRSERNDPGPIVSGSRQIYLTFPAESTFTEEDVSNYFNSFGPVQDVRIPCQQKRMFGFVTFVSADTVKVILSKGNPHYVCGARVLVKPYREKPKLFDRKYSEKFESPMYYHPRHIDMESELQSRWESSRLLRKHMMEEQELALELERRRLAELQVARKSSANQSYFGYSVDDLKVSEDDYEFPSVEDFNYMLDVLNTGSTSEDNPKHTATNCSDHESSQGLNLPDSPFASAIGSSISTAT